MTDKATDVTELKPCPFCGGEADIHHMPDGAHVQCFDCEANSRIFDGARDGKGRDREFAHEDAFEAWNLRTASEQPASGEVGEIVKFIDNFFEPWGSWKTLWWEGEVSDDAAFSADNALKHVANKLRALSAPREDERLRADLKAVADGDEFSFRCEACAAPLLCNADDFVMNDDGVSGCWHAMTENAPADKPCYAYRVGKMSAALSTTSEAPEAGRLREALEPWPGCYADLQRRRVTTLAKLGLMLSIMASGEAAEVVGYDAADLYAEVLMALAIEDAEDTDIALEVAFEHPDGDILIRAVK